MWGGVQSQYLLVNGHHHRSPNTHQYNGRFIRFERLLMARSDTARACCIATSRVTRCRYASTYVRHARCHAANARPLQQPAAYGVYRWRYAPDVYLVRMRYAVARRRHAAVAAARRRATSLRE